MISILFLNLLCFSKGQRLGPQAVSRLGNAFWGSWRALFFIKWLWTLALQILTLDLSFTLPHNSIWTTKWISSISNTCGGVCVSPMRSYVSLSSQYILMKGFHLALNFLILTFLLTLCLSTGVMLRGKNRPASQKWVRNMIFYHATEKTRFGLNPKVKYI